MRGEYRNLLEIPMTTKIRFTPSPQLDALIDLALAEDIGCGDATGDALIPMGVTARMEFIAREALVLAVSPLSREFSTDMDPFRCASIGCAQKEKKSRKVRGFASQKGSSPKCCS